MHRRAIDLNRAAIRIHDGAENPNQRRLSRTVVSYESSDLPGSNVYGDIVERDDAPEALADIPGTKSRGMPALAIDLRADHSDLRHAVSPASRRVQTHG
jgi:hypothetical protein